MPVVGVNTAQTTPLAIDYKPSGSNSMQGLIFNRRYCQPTTRMQLKNALLGGPFAQYLLLITLTWYIVRSGGFGSLSITFVGLHYMGTTSYQLSSLPPSC